MTEKIQHSESRIQKTEAAREYARPTEDVLRQEFEDENEDDGKAVRSDGTDVRPEAQCRSGRNQDKIAPSKTMKTIIQGARFGFMGAVLLMAISAPAQNLFVSSDNGNNGNKISEITPGVTVTTFFTQTTGVGPLAFNRSGDLFEGAGSQILEFSPAFPAGTDRIFASGLVDIGGLAFNSAGDLFVSDFNVNGSIAEFTPGGVESTFATGLDQPRGLVFNSAGDLFVGTINKITEITPGGAQSAFVSGLNGGVSSLAFNNAGNLFAVSDGLEILEITPNGTQSNFAPVSAAGQMAFNSQGTLFVANENNQGVLEYNLSGTKSTFVSGLGEAIGLAFQPVPEPSVLALLGIGVAGLIVRQRR